MKLVAYASLAVIASALAATVNHKWNSNDDEKLVRAVAAAALDRDGSDIHRVTKSTFKMADPVAELCAPAPRMPRHTPHKDYYCHVYVNELALKPMNSGEGVYPEGSLIIKQKYSDQRGINTELFTVMRKMGDGYDTENNNWEYSIVDASATTVMSRGRTDSCINCHTDYAGTDYVTRLYMQTNRK